MEKYIPLDALIAEIEKRKNMFYDMSKGCEDVSSAKAGFYAQAQTLEGILSFINSLEVKEVDLEEEIKEEYLKRRCYGGRDNMLVILNEPEFNTIAKHFFEIGIRVNNPITAADRGTAEEIIINLKRVESDYRINLTKEIEWVRNQVKKGEKV